jgi:hypothetical protein
MSQNLKRIVKFDGPLRLSLCEKICATSRSIPLDLPRVHRNTCRSHLSDPAIGQSYPPAAGVGVLLDEDDAMVWMIGVIL